MEKLMEEIQERDSLGLETFPLKKKPTESAMKDIRNKIWPKAVSLDVHPIIVEISGIRAIIVSSPEKAKQLILQVVHPKGDPK